MAPAGQRAVLIGGHVVDAPDRPVPRFPQRLVDRVTRMVGGVLDEWAVGPGTVVICGGARGADIIGAELAFERHARVLVCLALPRDEFEHTSVALPGTDWSARYRRVLSGAEVREPPAADAAGNAFARANDAMVRLARGLDPAPRALLVWDGRPGDGPGGTADLIERLGLSPGDPRLRVIDPTALDA